MDITYDFYAERYRARSGAAMTKVEFEERCEAAKCILQNRIILRGGEEEKYAVCAIAELLQRRALGEKELGMTSVNTDGYSVTYDKGLYSLSSAEVNGEIANIIRRYIGRRVEAVE